MVRELGTDYLPNFCLECLTTPASLAWKRWTDRAKRNGSKVPGKFPPNPLSLFGNDRPGVQTLEQAPDFLVVFACVSIKFLESSLRHRSEMVMYEAARAICNLPGVEMNDLSPAINVLQVCL